MSWSGTARSLSTPWVIVPVSLLLAISLALLWFFHNFEKKEIDIHRGTSPAARRNPLLAAERYLQASGLPAASRHGMELFAALPPPGDAIIIRRLPEGLGTTINDRLFNWVKDGGHLLLVPNPLRSKHPGAHTIPEKLGVQLYKEDDDKCACPTEESEENAEAELDDTTRDDDFHPYNSLIKLNIGGFPVQLKSFSPRLLEDQDQAANFRIDGSYHKVYRENEDQNLKDNNEQIAQAGAWLLQYNHGEGKITILSEMNLFYNRNIAEYDHAFFLSWLVRDADKVWLLYSSRVDSLMTVIWNRFTVFCISLFVLLLLISWRLQKQSGVLLRPEPAIKQNIMSHIDASGEYNWRINRLAETLESNRSALLQRWAGQKLGHSHSQQQENVAPSALATSDISERQIHEAFQQKVDNEQDLIQASRALQKIRNLIQGGESGRDDS